MSADQKSFRVPVLKLSDLARKEEKTNEDAGMLSDNLQSTPQKAGVPFGAVPTKIQTQKLPTTPPSQLVNTETPSDDTSPQNIPPQKQTSTGSRQLRGAGAVVVTPPIPVPSKAQEEGGAVSAPPSSPASTPIPPSVFVPEQEVVITPPLPPENPYAKTPPKVVHTRLLGAVPDTVLVGGDGVQPKPPASETVSSGGDVLPRAEQAPQQDPTLAVEDLQTLIDNLRIQTPITPQALPEEPTPPSVVGEVASLPSESSHQTEPATTSLAPLEVEPQKDSRQKSWNIPPVFPANTTFSLKEGADVPDMWDNIMPASSQSSSREAVVAVEQVFPRNETPVADITATTSVIEETPSLQKTTPLVSGGSSLETLRARMMQGAVGNQTKTDMSPPPEQTISLPEEKQETPRTRHAQAVADIAYTLQTLQKNPNAYALSNKDIEQYRSVYATGAPTDIPTQKPVEKPAVPKVRTFKGDMADVLMKNKTSVTGMIAMHEEKKGIPVIFSETPVPIKTSWRTRIYLFVFLSILFVGGGSVIIGMYFFSQQVPVTPVPNELFFFTDVKKMYDITGKDAQTVSEGLAKILSENLTQKGAFVRVTPYKTLVISSSDTQQKVLTVSDFMLLLGLKTPLSFTHSLTDRFVFGGYLGEKKGTFLVFETTDYEESFAGMLRWELTLEEDLRTLFTLPSRDFSEGSKPPVEEFASTSATSTFATSSIQTQPLPPTIAQENGFVDLTVANVRARGIKNKDGSVSLVWAVPNSNMIVVASNEETLQVIIQQMGARTF